MTNLEKNEIEVKENKEIQEENKDKTMAMLSHILGLFFGFLAPLVVYFIVNDSDQFNKNHSKEALNFQISLCIWYFISGLLTIVLIGFIGIFGLWVIGIIFCIKGAIAAKNGEEFRYPLTIRFFK